MVEEKAADPLGSVDAARQVRELIESDGRTLAEEADVDLADEPGALWRLLVLSNLLSNRIRSAAAVNSAKELWKIGCTTPSGTRATSWQQRVDALGRGGYRRYDFSTATRLGANASFVDERWADDLRSLHDLAVAEASTARNGRSRGAATTNPVAHGLARLLQEFDGIGPGGARIFLREVQGVWPDVGPVVDALVERGARLAGLPVKAEALSELAGEDMPRLCAALVRLARTR